MDSVTALEPTMQRLLPIAVIVLMTGCPEPKPSVPPLPAATATVARQLTVETTSGPVKWAKVGEPVTIGEKEVTLESVRFGKFRIQPVLEGEERDSEEDAIVARIRIANVGATKELRYSSWQGLEGVSLVDESGTEHFVIGVGYKPGWHVVGALGFANAPPGSYLQDVLRFKPPPPGAKTFRLTLPDQRAGDPYGPVPFRFEFTRDDLKK